MKEIINSNILKSCPSNIASISFIIMIIILSAIVAVCFRRSPAAVLNAAAELGGFKISSENTAEELNAANDVSKVKDSNTAENIELIGSKPEQTQVIQPSGTAEANANIIKKPVEFPMLENKVICIDPGHQSILNNGREPIAPDSSLIKEKMTFGTAGTVTKIPEYQLNLEVSLKLKKTLEESNAKVIMTRESNEVDVSNIERALMANRHNSDITVRIHADGNGNPEVKGISVLYPGNQYIKDSKLLSNSKRAAKIILEAIIANTSASNRGIVERNDLTGFNWSDRPVILIEMGFMTNPAEDRLLNTDEYQESIVRGIVQGLSDYFESVP